MNVTRMKALERQLLIAVVVVTFAIAPSSKPARGE